MRSILLIAAVSFTLLPGPALAFERTELIDASGDGRFEVREFARPAPPEGGESLGVREFEGRDAVRVGLDHV